MFGYVRPLKGDLRVREFARYRSIYCGLCKAIAGMYGHIARAAVTYDVTFFCLLLEALHPVAETKQQGCILNPFKKKPIALESPSLQLGADVSVLLAWFKGVDDRRDGSWLTGSGLAAAFYPAWRRVRKRQPALVQSIESALRRLAEAERGVPKPSSAFYFGNLLGAIFRLGAEQIRIGEQGLSVSPNDSVCEHAQHGTERIVRQDVLSVGLSEPYIQALERIGQKLGHWIYWLDAVDDWEKDRDNKEWNAFGAVSTYSNVVELATPLLLEAEADLDRTCALLPYVRDAGLIANIILSGLPAARETVIAGGTLEPI